MSVYRIATNVKKSKAIDLSIIADHELEKGGYQLQVTPNAIAVKANTKERIVYGIQSLLQTLPTVRTNAVLKVPVMQVKDYPRFAWRGMHLDLNRHFFSPYFINQYIDLMASYKLNTFHRHLVDDQGAHGDQKIPKANAGGCLATRPPGPGMGRSATGGSTARHTYY